MGHPVKSEEDLNGEPYKSQYPTLATAARMGHLVELSL
jgi:hypothetical protein